MLSNMKGVKMTGLANDLRASIEDDRAQEIRRSKKFRELLIIKTTLCNSISAKA
jgi:hypothetical protein